MKKLIICFIFSLIFLFSSAIPAFCAIYTPDSIDAKAALLVNLDNGAVVTEKNVDLHMAPASITKIVTAIVVIENCDDLEKVVTVQEEALRLLEGTNSSTAGLRVGEELTVRQLLYCLLTYSANDAANILAMEMSGDVKTFVAGMNAFVTALGCQDTHFVNPSGLDAEGHYTTARDLYTIYAYCLRNSLFADIVGTKVYELPADNKNDEARELRNTNSLFNEGIPDYYFEYARTGKTGTTDAAGRCLISTASYDGYNYLCVILGGEMKDYDDDGVDENMAYIETKRLYKWAFDNLRLRQVADPNIAVGKIPVELGRRVDSVLFGPGESVSALVPAGVNAQSVLIEPGPDTPDTVMAPLHKGDVIGTASILYAGEPIAEVPIVVMEDVERSWFRYVGFVAVRFVKDPVVQLFLLVVLCILTPLFILLFVVFPGARKRRRRSAVKMVDVKELMRQKGEPVDAPEELGDRPVRKAKKQKEKKPDKDRKNGEPAKDAADVNEDPGQTPSAEKEAKADRRGEKRRKAAAGEEKKETPKQKDKKDRKADKKEKPDRDGDAGKDGKDEDPPAEKRSAKRTEKRKKRAVKPEAGNAEPEGEEALPEQQKTEPQAPASEGFFFDEEKLSDGSEKPETDEEKISGGSEKPDAEKETAKPDPAQDAPEEAGETE